jgi:hypothetical protein
MPAQGQQTNSQTNVTPPPTYEELVRQVTQRVWELLQRDLQREKERRGSGNTR